MVSRKLQKFLKRNLGNQNKNKTDEVLQFISTFNPNNPPVYNAIKNCTEVLKRKNFLEFEIIKLTNSERQPPNLKNLLTKAELSNEKLGMKRCPDL